MIAPPAPSAPIGAYADAGSPPHDPVSAIIGQLRTSMLDVGTAVRLGWRGREVFYGTELDPPQRFVAPSQSNSPDNLRAGVAQSGVARKSLGKDKNVGRPPRQSPGAMI